MWQAVFIMFIAMSMIPSGDAAGKLMIVHHGVDPLFVAWSRFAVGALIALPLVPRGTLKLFADWRVWIRACLLMGGITSIQLALKTEPIANVFAAFFVGPIISYALSVLLLGEAGSRGRIVLMGIGFFGVMLVVRPGFGLSLGLGFALLAGCFYGAFLTSSKWLAQAASSRALLLTQLVIPALLLAPFGAPHTPDMSAPVAWLTLASAGFSLLGNLLLQTAYGRAPASALAPFVYFQLFAAAGLGWVLFADLPDPLGWAGLALVCGAGLGSALLRSPTAPAPRRG